MTTVIASKTLTLLCSSVGENISSSSQHTIPHHSFGPGMMKMCLSYKMRMADKYTSSLHIIICSYGILIIWHIIP